MDGVDDLHAGRRARQIKVNNQEVIRKRSVLALWGEECLDE